MAGRRKRPPVNQRNKNPTLALATFTFFIMEILQLIQKVTVDCKDNQRVFTSKERIKVIKTLLETTSYHPLYEGKLCYIFGKKSVKGQSTVLISSHIDCVYDRLFYKDHSTEHIQGTFDNSLTNACVLKNMLDDIFQDNVIVAFTGDEEEDGKGAQEVVNMLSQWNTNISTAMVLDLSEEGWERECPFTIENDLGIDIFKAHHIVEILKPYRDIMGFVHDSEPDEAWDYDEFEIPSFTLGFPIWGDMHDEDGVLARKSSLPIYCQVMALLANGLSNGAFGGVKYFIEVENDTICGIWVDENDCRSDNYIVVQAEENVLQLPVSFHGREIIGVKDFWCMGGQGKKTPSIKGLIVPDSYSFIGQKNFSQYPYLSFVYLPRNVRLGDFAFAYCSQLKKVYVGSPEDERLWLQKTMAPCSIYEQYQARPFLMTKQPHGIFDRCHPDFHFYI